ncbi:pyrroline-5-carboxylate reductase family protein [Roseovarius sp. C7]|uniref:pyrroline-5-carboxylate reductase family protein n=1 Tax=Roseovarius sp. C7 TaxID=3398643 RepID=UPI0039F513F1
MRDVTPLAFMGASGWLGRFMGPALLRAGVVAPDAFTGINRSGPSPAYADWPELRWSTDADTGLDGARMVVLSLRPDEFRAASPRCPGALVLSVMAGVSAAELRETTGARAVVRSMPNAAVEIGQSFSPWVADPATEDGDRAMVRALLGASGREEEFAREADIDVYSAICGAGPAWAALLLEALAAAGRAEGLSPEQAVAAAEGAVVGAGAMLRGQGAQAGAMVDAFIAYAGTTAAGLGAAREAGVDRAIAAGIAAATQKARALG